MIDKIEILIVGTHQPIIRTVARLIDKEHNWHASTAFSLQEAISLVKEKSFNIILIGAGLTESEEQEFSSRVQSIDISLPIIKHYGGGSGLLLAEIYQGLNQK